MIRTAALGFSALLLTASATLGCGFHNYTPQPTLVERLMSSDHIVLARQAEDDPFRYSATRTLEGSAETADIPLLVDSATRRRLAADPSAQVLIARDGAYGPWQRLAYVDAALRPVLDSVMTRLPDWELGGDEDRFALFASLLTHPDAQVSRLALRELDQADYALLRELDAPIDAERMLARLDAVAESDLKPIRILLLGLSGDRRALARLKSGVAGTAGTGGTYLGAYATAWIELAGPQAAAELAERYLTRPDLPAQDRESLAEALAIHSQTGIDVTVGRIHAVLAQTLAAHPDLAPHVARRFGARYDWSMRDALADLLARRAVTTLTDVLVVSQYVALADQAASDGTGN